MVFSYKIICVKIQIMSFEEIPVGHKLSIEELEEIALLFNEKLPPSPVDIEKYIGQLKEVEYGVEVLKDLLDNCLEYTIDVAELEKYSLEHAGEFDEERTEIDRKRSLKHDSTIDSINIFLRMCQKNDLDTSWFTWKSADRGKYGKFAILLTLNRFRNEITYFKTTEYIEKVRESLPSDQLDIDYERLKLGKTEIEIMIINYTQILSKVLYDDRECTESESQELNEISQRLQKDEQAILGAFLEIYKRGY